MEVNLERFKVCGDMEPTQVVDIGEDLLNAVNRKKQRFAGWHRNQEPHMYAENSSLPRGKIANIPGLSNELVAPVLSDGMIITMQRGVSTRVLSMFERAKELATEALESIEDHVFSALLERGIAMTDAMLFGDEERRQGLKEQQTEYATFCSFVTNLVIQLTYPRGSIGTTNDNNTDQYWKGTIGLCAIYQRQADGEDLEQLVAEHIMELMVHYEKRAPRVSGGYQTPVMPDFSRSEFGRLVMCSLKWMIMQCAPSISLLHPRHQAPSFGPADLPERVVTCADSRSLREFWQRPWQVGRMFWYRKPEVKDWLPENSPGLKVYNPDEKDLLRAFKGRHSGLRDPDLVAELNDKTLQDHRATLFSEMRGTCRTCKGWGPDNFLCCACGDNSSRYRRRYNESQVPLSTIFWPVLPDDELPDKRPYYGWECPLRRCMICSCNHVQPYKEDGMQPHCRVAGCDCHILPSHDGVDFGDEGSTNSADARGLVEIHYCELFEDPFFVEQVDEELVTHAKTPFTMLTFFSPFETRTTRFDNPPVRTTEWNTEDCFVSDFRPETCDEVVDLMRTLYRSMQEHGGMLPPVFAGLYTMSAPARRAGACRRCKGWGPVGYYCRFCKVAECRYTEGLIEGSSDMGKAVPDAPSYWRTEDTTGPLYEFGICGNSRWALRQGIKNAYPHFGPVGHVCLLGQCSDQPGSETYVPSDADLAPTDLNPTGSWAHTPYRRRTFYSLRSVDGVPRRGMSPPPYGCLPGEDE